MDNNIQPDKVITKEVTKTDNTISTSTKTQINSQNSPIKEPLAVGQLLQNTIKLLSQEGLNSINVAKAMHSLKGIFPTEFSQIQLQQRQAQIDKPVVNSDIKATSFPPIPETTKKNWFNSQVLHAKVLQANSDGSATLVIDKQSIEVKIDSNSVLKLQVGQSLALVVEKSSDQKISFNLASIPEQSAKLIQLIQKMVSKQQAMPALLASLDSAIQYTNAQSQNNNTANTHTANMATNTERSIPPVEPVVSQENKAIKTSAATNIQTKADVIASNKPVMIPVTSNIPQNSTAVEAIINNNVPLKKVETLSAPLVKAIEQLIDKFSSLQQLSLGDGLKQAISNSGLFLENHLQIQKTESVNLDRLSSAISADKQTQNTPAIANILSKSIEQLEQISQKLSVQVNSKISINAENVQLLDKSLQMIKEQLLDLKPQPAENNKTELLSLLKNIQQLVKNQQISATNPQLPQSTQNHSQIAIQNQLQTQIQPLQNQTSSPTIANSVQNIAQQIKQIKTNQVKLSNEQIKQLATNIQNIIKQSQEISLPAPLLEKLQQATVNARDVTKAIEHIKVQLEASSKDNSSEVAKQKLVSQLLEQLSKTILASDNKNLSQSTINELQQPLNIKQTPSVNKLLARAELISQIVENKPSTQINLPLQQQVQQQNQLIQAIAKQLTHLHQPPLAVSSPMQQQFKQLIQQPASLANINKLLDLMNPSSASSNLLQPLLQIPLSPLTSQNIKQLVETTINNNVAANPNSQLTAPDTNLKQLLNELKLMSQTIEQQLKNQANSTEQTINKSINSYPKAFSQSIHQILEQVNYQFNSNNKSLLNNNNPSVVQFQAQQFIKQIQQVTQTINQAMNNSSESSLINSQINNDLKLNIQRLLSILQNIGVSERVASQTATNSQSTSSLLQNIMPQDLELDRQALPTRNKHAQVAAAQQNQLLQMANPVLFQQMLLEQLDGVMSRIVATQAATREQPESNINMALELPFKFQDKSQVLQLKFTSENKNKNKNTSNEKIWTANLAFELQSLGAIRIYIVLNGKDIAMQFWTEKPETQQIFVANFNSLKSRLKLAGYNISEMTSSMGIPEEAEEEIKVDKKGTIDERV
ncbi:MAG: flagellar hook-length control protein FliK [Pseudomonadota bacterium]